MSFVTVHMTAGQELCKRVEYLIKLVDESNGDQHHHPADTYGHRIHRSHSNLGLKFYTLPN